MAKLLRPSAGQAQALDGPPCEQVLAQDLVEVAAIHERIPDRLGVDDHHRALGAAVETAGAVDPNPSLACDAKLLGAAFKVVSPALGVALGAALGPILAGVGTEEDVMLVVGHGGLRTDSGDCVGGEVTIGAALVCPSATPATRPDRARPAPS